ncbi:restriction endonuclease subunit S [Vibrio parahaemolyticus]|nr:restriction endonuclease subunit S [Vibrio parahaemolyticus]HCE1969507.1 restriction endonuclease subunit S [Vibrio parahaemolyticus]
MGNKVSIGDVVSLSQGFAVNSKSKHLMGDSGLPLLRITDLINGTEAQYLTKETAPTKCIAHKHEIIFTRTGQVGLVFRGREGVVHNNCFKVIPNEDLVTHDYIYWTLKQPHIIKLANNVASGSVQKDLNHSAFKSIDIDLIPKTVQEQNCQILNRIDEKINLNRQINQTLEQMAQTLFKSWFVDFDPVIDNALDAIASGKKVEIPEVFETRVERRKAVRESADFKPLPDDVRQLFPSEFEESELGWVPKGWRGGNISDLALINPSSWTKKNAPDQVEYVDLASAKFGTIQSSEIYAYDEAPSRARRILFKHDTIFGMVRPANRSFAYVDRNGLTGSTGFVVVRAKESAARSFVHIAITSNDAISEFVRIADGAAYPAIKPDDIADYPTVLPCPEVLKLFEGIVSNYREKIATNISSSKGLAELRDTLLPKLISGELRLDSLQVEQAKALVE